MRINKTVVPIAALAIALGSFPAEAAQRAERRNRESQAQGQDRQRTDSSAERRDRQVNRGRGAADRSGERSPAVAARGSRSDNRYSRDNGRSGGSAIRRDYDRSRPVDRRFSYGYSRNYYAPRLLPRRSPPRRYYDFGGRLSLYLGIGSGYRYGSPYSGRVYGYRGRVASYGVYQSYGDVRLKVSPRDAAVYVDGYYAGIVDDFDGFFQRLTLEVGPHEIEIVAPGLEAQVFDVYVNPTRTIDLHADLRR